MNFLIFNGIVRKDLIIDFKITTKIFVIKYFYREKM